MTAYENPSATATPNTEKCYPVASGEAFQINVASKEEQPIMGSYVVVDIDNKALSTTDKAAIKA